MKCEWKFLCSLCAMCGLLFFTSCSSESRRPVVKLPLYSISNQVVAGELRQVLEVTNGLSLYFTESNLVVWFCKDSDILVDFDPASLKPSNVMLEMPASGEEPAQAVWDINADGVPEMRRIKGHSTNEIFYYGEWYAKQVKDTNLVISVGGHDVSVRYDGRRWIDAAPKVSTE